MKKVKIDVVSDVACPWCAVGYNTLMQALESLTADGIDVELMFQPFELNPTMGPGGQDAIEYLSKKYGNPPDKVRENQRRIIARAAEVGFMFHPDGRKRVYNTFNGHRLLHWAAQECGADAQRKLKYELLTTYFTLAVSMDDAENLLDAVERAGLDRQRAQEVLDKDLFAADVRATEQRFTDMGIHSVPSVIVNEQYLLQGAQPADAYADAIRQAANG
jgi:predicted DsbA family dithiol-disulfide isomerase